MITHRLLPVVLAALFAVAHSSTAEARPRPARTAQAPGADAKLAAKRDKVRQRIRALRAWRLTEALDLDEATAARLFPILNRYDEKLAAQLKEGARLRRELRAIVKGKAASAASANALVDQLVKQQRAQWSLEERRFAEVRAVLTPVQAAQILIVLPQIDRTIHREITQAMRNARQQKKGGPAPAKAGAAKGDNVKNPFRARGNGDSGELAPNPYRTTPKRKRRGQPDGIVNPF